MQTSIIIQLTTEELELLIQSSVKKALAELKEFNQESASDVWLGINELCEYHPDKPTKPTVYGWVNAGTIPVHKGGKKLRFLKSEIDKWLKS
jgi:excisionase family DNA binding protein